jgi:hypothetical protein
VRPALGAVCFHRIVKISFWRDLRYVLLVYIILLNVAFGETFLSAVCVHRKVKNNFLRDLQWLLLLYIAILMLAFGETCDGCCLCLSYC